MIRLRIHAVKHGVIAPLPAAPVFVHYARGHILRFVPLVIGEIAFDQFPVPGVRPKVFALALGVILYYSVGRVKDMTGAAVILLQADGAAVGILLFKGKYVFNCRAAELIYTLVVITYNAYITAPFCKKRREEVLETVCVLILVNEHIFKPLLPIAAHIFMPI